MEEFVSLNVGGHIYTTARTTLVRYPDSMLGSMFSGRMPTTVDNEGRFLIDGDGPLFRYVLNFLRRSELILPENFPELDMLMAEADYYQISELVEALKNIRDNKIAIQEEIKRKLDEPKVQEFLEVEFECANGHWIIFARADILKKIPTVMESLHHLNLIRPAQFGRKFGPEENGLILPRERPLNRLKLFRELTQMSFELQAVSSSGGDERSTDRWVFSRSASIT
ncbi:putative BTB/POZ domain-containing protein KCTD6-like [Apostichopus japonicus]|uniref:Putative BTB/POZ domain-containing protein KCTD6-like n=2 Tax=Stichopus japonicus TaxID=307972 RepID=A0A2G8KXD4_STIJA|nr:putative BTB/POZ domain-containing protein KCTD6-like [Apostichopus japonicus]